MNILITGNTGLIGDNLFRRLKEEGHSVYGMSRRDNLDLRDKEMVNKFVKLIKPDVIYHLAAQAAESRGQVSPIDMTENNIMIFVNVLRAAINSKVKKFIYTSSVAVYGEATVPYREDGPTIPKDVYGVNKLACEQILKIMSKVHGLDYTIFRPHNVYGPGQSMTNPYKNVVALIMRRLMENESYKLYGNGEMRRAFSYVEDVVDVLISSLDKFSKETVNVGSDHDISIKELSDMLQEISGIQGQIVYEDARPQEISMFLANHDLQSSITTYKETPIREGLQKTWDWAKKNGLGVLEKQENEIL